MISKRSTPMEPILIRQPSFWRKISFLNFCFLSSNSRGFWTMLSLRQTVTSVSRYCVKRCSMSNLYKKLPTMRNSRISRNRLKKLSADMTWSFWARRRSSIKLKPTFTKSWWIISIWSCSNINCPSRPIVRMLTSKSNLLRAERRLTKITMRNWRRNKCRKSWLVRCPWHSSSKRNSLLMNALKLIADRSLSAAISPAMLHCLKRQFLLRKRDSMIKWSCSRASPESNLWRPSCRTACTRNVWLRRKRSKNNRDSAKKKWWKRLSSIAKSSWRRRMRRQSKPRMAQTKHKNKRKRPTTRTSARLLAGGQLAFPPWARIRPWDSDNMYARLNSIWSNHQVWLNSK